MRKAPPITLARVPSLDGPTPERVAHAETVVKPEKSREADRPHHRIVNAVETMHRRKWLTDEQLAAYLEFDAAFQRARSVRGLTVIYQIRSAIDEDSWPTVSSAAMFGSQERDHDDHRAAASIKVQKGLDAISYPPARAALTKAAGEDATLAAIGKHVSGCLDGDQAIAAARELLKMATHGLAVAYGLLPGGGGGGAKGAKR